MRQPTIEMEYFAGFYFIFRRDAQGRYKVRAYRELSEVLEQFEDARRRIKYQILPIL